jgi:hypothetical protein
MTMATVIMQQWDGFTPERSDVPEKVVAPLPELAYGQRA